VTEINRRIEAEKYVGVTIAVIESDQISHYDFGKTDLTGKKSPDKNTIFEIGSITKVFTTLLLADMCNRTDMTLEDPVRKYLPASVAVPVRNGKQITLLHLATHSSGLPRMPDNFAPADPQNPYADYSAEQMLDFLSNHILSRDIGEIVEYSNFGMGLLGFILSRKAGMSYESLVRERITNPLGMKHSGITLTKKMKKRLAPGHAMGMAVPNWDIDSLAGAGALRSSSKDMAKFIAANMGIRSTKLHKTMSSTHQPRKSHPDSDMEVALGWHIRPHGESATIWHNGGTGGYRSFTGFLKDGTRGVVVLGNTTETVDDIGFHLLDSAFPLKETKPSASIELSKRIAAKNITEAISRRTTIFLKTNSICLVTGISRTISWIQPLRSFS